MKKFSRHTTIINTVLIGMVMLLTTAATASPTTKPVKKTGPEKPSVSQVPLTEATLKLTDPTRPPDALINPEKMIETTAPLDLTAIFYSKERQRAVISGQTLEPGDVVGEYTIINIHRDTVELISSDGEELKLSLVPQVKQPSEMKGN